MGFTRCPNINLVALAHPPKNTVVQGEKVAILAYIRCKEWLCVVCLELNRQMWREFLTKRLPEISRDWWFMTLTSPAYLREHFASYKNLQHGIDVLLKRMRRLFGNIEYVRVFEMHKKDKTLHAHFIITGLTPYVALGASVKHRPMFLAVKRKNARVGFWGVKSWLKHVAVECKIGYMADIKPIPSTDAVHYITKYLTKEQQAFAIEYVRRIQTSRKIGSPKYNSEYEWQVGHGFGANYFEEMELLLDTGTGELIDPRLWEQEDMYPDIEEWRARRGKS